MGQFWKVGRASRRYVSHARHKTNTYIYVYECVVHGARNRFHRSHSVNLVYKMTRPEDAGRRRRGAKQYELTFCICCSIQNVLSSPKRCI